MIAAGGRKAQEITQINAMDASFPTRKQTRMAKVQLGPEYRKVFPVISSSSAVTEWQLHTEIVGIADEEDTGQHSHLFGIFTLVLSSTQVFCLRLNGLTTLMCTLLL